MILTTREQTLNRYPKQIYIEKTKLLKKNYLSIKIGNKNNILKFQPKRRSFAQQTFVTENQISSSPVVLLSLNYFHSAAATFISRTHCSPETRDINSLL